MSRRATLRSPLSAIAEQVGYGSEYAFSKAFRRELGVAPSRYRAEAQSGP